MKTSSSGKWVQGKVFLDRQEDSYIYKRPNTNNWQYYLLISGEGEERKSTGIKGKPDDESYGKEDALKVLLERKLEVMSRVKQGLKARRIKKMFDFIDEFLEEEKKRIAPYNKKGFITSETFRIKKHHLSLLKKFYKNKSIKLENLDYPKLFEYPIWRSVVDKEWNPHPPERNHTILTELTTIKAYFYYLFLKGYIPREPTFKKIQRESISNTRRDYLNPRQYQQTINTLRKWCNSENLTPTQKYNKQVIYQSILVMSNACIRIGELKNLKWFDLEPNTNLTKEEQKIGHLIRIRKESTKTGEPRIIQTPTTQRFNTIRELAGIQKDKGSPFPHIPPDRRNEYVIGKYNHHDNPLGTGTWNRMWIEIKSLCENRYWNNKKISWYSFRHTGISFAVSREVPLLQLSKNCGCGLRYIQDVYYHHESESKGTWDILTKNRNFYEHIKTIQDELLVEIEDVMNNADKEYPE